MEKYIIEETIMKDEDKINEINGKIRSLEITEHKDDECIISINQISKIEAQNENIPKSLCKIKIEIQSETILEFGFLIKFWIEQENFYCLIFNGHPIKNEIINNNKISIYFNNNLKIKPDYKKRYIKWFKDIGLDITVIEIIDEDNISKDSFLWDEDETDNNRLINSQIYTEQYLQGKKLVSTKGKIIRINKYEFIYSSNIGFDSSGCLIFLEKNNGILGIHKGNDEDKKENYGY